MNSKKNLKDIINKLEKMDGNLKNGYISFKNISMLPQYLQSSAFVGDLLISVFLCNESSTLELLAFELSIEICENLEDIIYEKVTGQYAIDGHTRDFDRKIIVGANNYEGLEKYFSNYLKKIQVSVQKEKKLLPNTNRYKTIKENSEIFFQIY